MGCRMLALPLGIRLLLVPLLAFSPVASETHDTIPTTVRHLEQMRFHLLQLESEAEKPKLPGEHSDAQTPGIQKKLTDDSAPASKETAEQLAAVKEQLAEVAENLEDKVSAQPGTPEIEEDAAEELDEAKDKLAEVVEKLGETIETDKLGD